MGEEMELTEKELQEKIAGLVTKAKKSGMPYGILKKVYDRGMAAYKTGHRPGTTAQQWAFARVNSFTTKSSGTWGKADKDLADKVRKSEEVELDEVRSKNYVVNFKSGLGGRKASKTVLAKNEDDAESIVIKKYNLNQDQILSVRLASKKEEIELEEVNISDYVVNTMRDIVRSKSARNLKLKGGSVKVDMNTANMMLQVLDKVNPMTKKKIMNILDKGTKMDFMKVNKALMKAIG